LYFRASLFFLLPSPIRLYRILLMSTLKITGLFIYPIKSMKAIALEQAQLTPMGLLNDRLWMVVRSNGRFVTQRDIPQLALVHTGLNEEGVVLSMPGHGSVTVPFEFADGHRIETNVWGDVCQTVDQGERISRWLTQALGSESPLRLVRMNPEFSRPQNHAEIFGEETTTVFADAAPFLVANEASLDRLNSELESNSLRRVPMNRFRPNIVVQGLDPFAEHELAGLNADHYQLKLRTPCERCVVTTIDQDTAEKDPQRQPFKTLATINPMPGNDKAPAFAQYATLGHGTGQYMELGDRIEALSH
jgi:uncharacterized protein YcbX